MGEDLNSLIRSFHKLCREDKVPPFSILACCLFCKPSAKLPIRGDAAVKHRRSTKMILGALRIWSLVNMNRTYNAVITVARKAPREDERSMEHKQVPSISRMSGEKVV